MEGRLAADPRIAAAAAKSVASTDPADVLAASRRGAQQHAQITTVARTRVLLAQAQKDLERRIERAIGRGNDPESFTVMRLRQSLVQVRHVVASLKQGIHGVLLDEATRTAPFAAHGTIAYLKAAEAKFRGIAQPLALNEAALSDAAVVGARASLVRRIATDPMHPGQPGVLDRYGMATIEHFENVFQRKAATGASIDEVREDLVARSPFLQAAPAHWAERLARTETMAAHNAAALATLENADEQLGDLLKILCATFDDRTGSDSYAVHGQIRKVSENFDSWFGSYAHPPNRPNDREVVVPHRMSWPIPANLAPRSSGEIASAWKREGRKGGPPGRPNLSTVDRSLIGKVQPPAIKEAEEQKPTEPKQREAPEAIAPVAIARPVPATETAPQAPSIEETAPMAPEVAPVIPEPVVAEAPPPPVEAAPEPPPVEAPPPPLEPAPVKKSKKKKTVDLPEPTAPTELGDPANILAQKIGEQGGSNPGGLYRGADGVERYVKFYADPTQAINEHLANAVYRDLGLGAPKSTLFEHDGKLAYASEMLHGGKLLRDDLTKENAREFLKGFVADVVTANWDAAGLTHDNAKIIDGKIHRIDNGGSFLYRAQGERKPGHVLEQIPEWEGFFKQNKAYGDLAKIAGVTKAEDLAPEIKDGVAKLTALRDASGGWANYVDKLAPGLTSADRERIVSMLDVRTNMLAKKAKELAATERAEKKAAKAAKAAAKDAPTEPLPGTVLPHAGLTRDAVPVSDHVGHQIQDDIRAMDLGMLPGEEREPMYELNIRANNAKVLVSNDTRQAIALFSGSSYGSIRGSEMAGKPNELSNQITKAFDVVPPEQRVVYRGIKLGTRDDAEKVIDLHLKTSEWGLGHGGKGATSSASWDPRVSGDAAFGAFKYKQDGMIDTMGSPEALHVLYRLRTKRGIPIQTMSNIPEEREILLSRDARFRTLGISFAKSNNAAGKIMVIDAEEI